MRSFTFFAGTLLAVSLPALTSCDKATQILKGGSKNEASGSTATPLPDDGSGKPRELKEADFPGLIATRGKLVVVVFHADWCGPCKALAPTIESVSSEYAGQVTVGRFNVDQCKTLSAEKGVRGIPDVRFYRDGQAVGQFTGLLAPDQVRAKYKEFTAGIKPVTATATTKGAGPAGKDAPPAQPVTRMKKDWMPPGMEKATPENQGGNIVIPPAAPSTPPKR